MKIGILTFHWATNYGAVLQAYALSKYLADKGNDVKLIDYYPPKYKKTILNAFATKHLELIPGRIRDISKEKIIEEFRKKYLNRTQYIAHSTDLTDEAFDCIICGSDQIWNESFIRYAERKHTYVYFLDFASKKKLLASYAASFGTTKYDEKLKNDIRQYIERLDFVSVRENTGLDILKDMLIDNACIVPDPTLLVTGETYENMLLPNKKKRKYNFVYMLHGKAADAKKLTAGTNCVTCGNIGIEEWLTDIYYAENVVTNSFHGVVFSIMFHKPFTAVLIKGSGMNDRIVTLLKKTGLENRISGDEIVTAPIDWEAVDKKTDIFRKDGYDYLDKILNFEKRTEDED